MLNIHVLNGKKKKSSKKAPSKKKAPAKASKAPRAKKKASHAPAKKKRGTMAKKKKSSKKKRSTTTAIAHYVRSKVCKKKGKKRRGNPGRFKLGNVGNIVKELGGMAAGLVAVGLLVKKLPPNEDMGSGPSSLAGERWSIAQYAGAGSIALLAPIALKPVAKWVPVNGVRLGALALIALKAVYTELVPKIPGASEFLGEVEGAVKVDGNKQSWIFANGSWNAMQGLGRRAMGGLVNASAMDGMGGLVNASAMDGADDDDDVRLGGDVMSVIGRRHNPILQAYA